MEKNFQSKNRIGKFSKKNLKKIQKSFEFLSIFFCKIFWSKIRLRWFFNHSNLCCFWISLYEWLSERGARHFVSSYLCRKHFGTGFSLLWPSSSWCCENILTWERVHEKEKALNFNGRAPRAARHTLAPEWMRMSIDNEVPSPEEFASHAMGLTDFARPLNVGIPARAFFPRRRVHLLMDINSWRCQPWWWWEGLKSRWQSGPPKIPKVLLFSRGRLSLMTVCVCVWVA